MRREFNGRMGGGVHTIQSAGDREKRGEQVGDGKGKFVPGETGKAKDEDEEEKGEQRGTRKSGEQHAQYDEEVKS
tara:strand:+ start:76 stop:300 length:225 start_codon:yes stop_codon:yes gene_type:complete